MKNTAKHTMSFGWLAVPNKPQDKPDGYYLILENKSDAKNIASVIPCIGMTKAEVKGNADLIAIAPDLYQACFDLLNCSHQQHFAVRLNDEELKALQTITMLINKLQ